MLFTHVESPSLGFTEDFNAMNWMISICIIPIWKQNMEGLTCICLLGKNIIRKSPVILEHFVHY